MNSKYVSERFMDLFKSDPNRKVAGFAIDVGRTTQCSFSMRQAYRAKQLALEAIHGKAAEQYAWLWDFRDELLRSNEGSTVLVGLDGEGKFQNLYICLKAMKDGMLNGMRPIIGVDGCHLWGPYKGVLLTAVGVDPNNNIFPIAWAVVTQEDYENWGWFLKILKSDLAIDDCKKWTFMSDKQKGLMKAFDEVFSDANNRFCVRHLHGNFKKAGFGGQALKEALWKAARATTVNELKLKIAEMQLIDPNAVKWFDDKPASQWSKSHFNYFPKCDMLLNNGCETFNKVISDARAMPIVSMCSWLHDYAMKRNQINRDRADAKWKDSICPKITQLVEKFKDRAGEGVALKASGHVYKISMSDNSAYVVNLDHRTCTCRRWELIGIPCSHAICAMNATGADPYGYIHDYYKVVTYKKIYGYVVMPTNGRDEWSRSNMKPILPPNDGRTAGRPGSARRLEVDEVPTKTKKKPGRKSAYSKQKPEVLKRQQVSVKCSFCKEIGHNKRGCKHRKEQERTGIPYVPVVVENVEEQNVPEEQNIPEEQTVPDEISQPQDLFTQPENMSEDNEVHEIIPNQVI